MNCPFALQMANEVSQWKARYDELLARSEEEGGALAQITQECRSTRSEFVKLASEHDEYKQQTLKVGETKALAVGTIDVTDVFAWGKKQSLHIGMDACINHLLNTIIGCARRTCQQNGKQVQLVVDGQKSAFYS